MEGDTGRNYPWARHCLALAPMVATVALVHGLLGSEQAVEDYFIACREGRPSLTVWVDRFSDYGNFVYYFLYAGLLVYGVWRRKTAAAAFALAYAASLIATLIVVEACKFSFGRPRPWSDDPVEPFTTDSENHSFPSAHVTETIVTALPFGQRYGKVFLPLLVGLSPALAALARLYLGHHHPTDIFGSAAVGSLGMYLAWRFVPFFEKGPVRRTGGISGLR